MVNPLPTWAVAPEAVHLFDRVCELAIDDLKFLGHRVAFDVEKSLAPDPNTATIRIWNLSENTRKQLTQAKAPLVRLSAGYKDGKTNRVTQIFYGSLIHVQHAIEGADVVTYLSTGDGIEEYRKKRISISFGPGTKTSEVFQAIVKELGLKKGNSNEFLLKLRNRGVSEIYASGAVLSGSAANEMTNLCRSANLEWSIQDQNIQILDRDAALQQSAIKLTPLTGMIGSPTISNKGVVSFQCLIVPDLLCGRQVAIESKFIKGSFRIEKLKYSGDTHGTEWYGYGEAFGKIRTPPSSKKAA